jgi:hypothetical protein
MPLIETTGSGSAKALGLNSASGPVNYIEDVFSTYLYTGNGSSQTITNGIDLSTKGGLVWLKSRSDATENLLYDTARGTYNYLISSTTGAQSNGSPTGVSSFNTTGFGVAGTTIGGGTNANGSTYASWTFRKQAKFFDIVTYTGNGSNRTIAHNLGSVPGCIIVKRTDTTGAWAVYHRSLANTEYMVLNTTAAKASGATYWNSTTPTSTVFSLGTATDVNANGGTYVAYLFAHDAGGFGTSGTDNVISCGGVTLDSGGGNTTVNLGYEPQWILARPSNQLSSWTMFDNMRGWAVGGSQQRLRANLSNTEDTQTNWINITSTGFVISSSFSNPSDDVIYIAIRRGPMKTPTSGTSVFTASAYTPSVNTVRSTNFPVDLTFSKARTDAAEPFWWLDRLRGYPTATGLTTVKRLESDSTAAETTGTSLYPQLANVWNAQYTDGQYLSGSSSIFYLFGRAPSFMDVVCYTGTGVARTINHNLGVAPEMMIIKDRTPGGNEWAVYAAPLGNQAWLALNRDYAATTSNPIWNNTTPTSSVFSVGVAGDVNGSGYTLVAYLFASCPGVSKVGSYSGTGATQTISCGFAARFVMIKRTDSTGSWWVWDTARGMVSGTDPRLALNSIAAETNANWVYTDASGFQIVTTDATVNASGGSYIYLAIA